MTELLIFTLLFLCIGLVGYSLLDKERMLQFPGLTGWTVGFMIMPQLFALMGVENRLPANSLTSLVFMIILCVIMTVIGFYANPSPSSAFHWKFSIKRLIIGAVILAAISQVASFMLYSLPTEVLDGKMWSGLPVKYLFFAQAGRYAFSIALVVFMITRNKWALLLILPHAFDSIQILILYGRRTNTAIFILTILCAFWFSRRQTVPRWGMALGVLVFVLFVFNIGEYRAIAKRKDSDMLKQVAQIEWEDTFRSQNLVGANAIEMQNASYIIAASRQSGRFDYGATLWNWLVMAYVPRQLVGSELKSSLLLGVNVWDVVYETLHYKAPFGSCTTGVAEAFYSFSYFGCLLFFAIGYVMRRLWEGAMRGDIIYQVVYFNFLAMAIGVYNGTMGNAITPWLHMIFFMGPVLYIARDRRSGDLSSDKDVLQSLQIAD